MADPAAAKVFSIFGVASAAAQKRRRVVIPAPAIVPDTPPTAAAASAAAAPILPAPAAVAAAAVAPATARTPGTNGEKRPRPSDSPSRASAPLVPGATLPTVVPDVATASAAEPDDAVMRPEVSEVVSTEEADKAVGFRRDDPDSDQVEIDYGPILKLFPDWRTWQPDAARDDCSFQVLETDWYLDASGAARRLEEVQRTHPQLYEFQPVVRLFGRNNKGQTVLVHSRNFLPYCYVQVPPEDEDLAKDEYLRHFREALEHVLQGKRRYKRKLTLEEQLKALEAEKPKRHEFFSGMAVAPAAPAAPADDVSSHTAAPSSPPLASAVSTVSTVSTATPAVDPAADTLMREEDAAPSQEELDESHRKLTEQANECEAKYRAAATAWQRDHTAAKAEMDKYAKQQPCIVSAEYTLRRSLHYYTPTQSKFIKVAVCDPGMIGQLRKHLLDKGLVFRKPSEDQETTQFLQTFDSNVSFEMRYMVNTKMMGPAWITVPKGRYHLRQVGDTGSLARAGRSEIELDVAYDQIKVHSHLDVAWSLLAPYFLLSFDIECAGSVVDEMPKTCRCPETMAKRAQDPEWDKKRPKNKPICRNGAKCKGDLTIQIGCQLYVDGDAAVDSILSVLFTVDSCKILPGTQVIACASEKEMLERFFAFFMAVRPDIHTGYNISGFDWPYIQERALILGAKGWDELSRFIDAKSQMKNGGLSSNAFGDRDFQKLDAPGTIQLDVLEEVRKEHKLRSYTLNSVAKHFLQNEKLDLHHSQIAIYHARDAYHRRIIADYCRHDAMLPVMLLRHIKFIINLMEMARATGVTLSYLLYRGQQVKVVSLILRTIYEMDLVFPYHQVDNDAVQEKFKGATVLTALSGYYDVPIATLDFARSLLAGVGGLGGA